MSLLVRITANEESTNESPVPCLLVSWNRSSSSYPGHFGPGLPRHRELDVRLRAYCRSPAEGVNTSSRELSRVEGDLSALLNQRDQLASSGGQKRQELRRGIEQRDTSIAELTSQLNKEADILQKNLEGIREACRIVRDKCMVPRSQAEDRQYAVEVDRMTHELTQQREDRKRLQAQIDALQHVPAGVNRDSQGALEERV
jgi:hypothetical protein